MKEYLVCKPEYARKTRFLPAHLIYKIENGHLMREQIPVSLNGGVMVVAKIIGELDFLLTKKILAECTRFNFRGVMLALSPIPDKNAVAFADELCNLLKSKKISLYLPLTYSHCTDAILLIPAITNNCSFSDYLKEICAEHPSRKFSLELTAQCIEFKIPQKESVHGVPISNKRLKELLESGVMTFYSHELCTNYFTHSGSFFVFDTPETLKVKKEIAENLGISSCFYVISPKNTVFLQKLEESI